MKTTSQKIPQQLVYEIYKGKPIHYRGYKDVLKGTKTYEGIMGSSFIQSLIITELILFLGSKIAADFQILSNELGLIFGKNSRRAADIAIYHKDQLKNIKNKEKQLTIPPKYVIEVDIKASQDDIDDSTSYYHNKTDELLNFGVESVFWIFTKTEKVLIAHKEQKNWEIGNWADTAIELEGHAVNIEELLEGKV